LQCVLAAKILTVYFVVCTLAVKKKIRAGFDMSDRTIPLSDVYDWLFLDRLTTFVCRPCSIEIGSNYYFTCLCTVDNKEARIA
jgi:hypothetical protein